MADSDLPGQPLTLPPPELNPLVNPTLNKHLGRWAQVYLTSPPEKRDEAVAELLRQLESEEAEARFSEDTNNASASEATGTTSATTFFQTSTCQSCGFTTRPNQRFCGRCGVRLLPAASEAPPAEVRLPDRPWNSDLDPAAYAAQDSRTDGTDNPAEREAEPFQSTLEDPDSNLLGFYGESQPFWYSYRFFIAAALAIVIALLGYLAWHAGQVSPASSRLPLQAPAAASAAPIQPANNAKEAPGGNGEAGKPAVGHLNQVAGTPKAPDDARKPQSREPDAPQVTAQKDAAAGPGNGVSELEAATELLDGRSGGRNSAQAAEFLWKSVSKRNTEAALLLANLYLRGDGVPKNCDQGRLLLDIAARKGSQNAASQLRNLQAFGCQ